MTRELRRDTETGKLSRDAATGALMRKVIDESDPDDCEFCDPNATPDKITVTISGLTECTCFRAPGALGGDHGAIVQGTAEILNGQSFVLEQYGGPGGYYGGEPCVWFKQIYGGYFGDLRLYPTDTACAGALATIGYPIDYLDLYVEKISLTELLIEFTIGAIYPWGGYSPSVRYYWPIYSYQDWTGSAWIPKAATIVDCINVSTLANQTVCGSVPPPWYCACDGGAVTLEEGQTVSTFTDYRTAVSDASVQWTPAANNYLNINQPPGAEDDDSSYNWTLTGWDKDIFNFNPFNLDTGAIGTSVEVVGRFRRMVAGGSYLARSFIRVNGTIYYGPSEQFLVGAYFTRTATWTTNPATGLAWTITDINGTGSYPLQNFGYECMGFLKTVRCTQSYIKANYSQTY